MTGKTIRDITADIKKCDFRGCTVFGKFQNTKAKLEYTKNNLPKKYIDRLIDFKVPDDVTLTTTDVYLAMLEGGFIRTIKGLDNVKQMVDYNLVPLKEKIWNYRKTICEHKIDISYTGAFIYEYGMESIGKENYYINLEARAKEAYLNGDMDYVSKVYNDLNKETKQNIVSLALKDRKRSICKKTQK